MATMADFYARHHVELMKRFVSVKPPEVRGRWAASLAYWIAVALPDHAAEFSAGQIRQWRNIRRGLPGEASAAIIAASKVSGMYPPLTPDDFLPDYRAHGASRARPKTRARA